MIPLRNYVATECEILKIPERFFDTCLTRAQAAESANRTMIQEHGGTYIPRELVALSVVNACYDDYRRGTLPRTIMPPRKG